MFQFITISFNHQKYIIEHLESIKFQIQNYNIKNAIYVLCDDASTDNTIKLVKKWLSINSYLFSKTKVIKSRINLGIVKNFLKAISQIETKEYKILAGDDLFGFLSVKSVPFQYDLIATPVIQFTSNGLYKVDYMHHYFIQTINNVRDKLKIGNPFFAPGVFINHKLFEEKDLLKYLSKFTWIEDLPLWYYIFNLRNKFFSYKALFSPIIMYRLNVGISTKPQSKSKTYYSFNKEVDYIRSLYKFNKMNNSKKRPFTRFLNPLYIFKRIEYVIISLFSFLMYIIQKSKITQHHKMISYHSSIFFNKYFSNNLN